MQASPRTIARLIQQVERFITFHEWDEAAVRCYRILALEPENARALTRLRHIYHQPELIDAMCCAMARLFAPQDASPHHHRRKLAFSYRVLSRWRGWQSDPEQTPPVDDLEEVAQMLGHAYLTGEDDELFTAWELYVRACAEDPDDKTAIQWWMAKQYAMHGFFADAAEVLTEVLSNGDEDRDAHYLLAELRWWRDQSDGLAWLA